MKGVRIAVLLPCYNESLTIAKTVADFRKALPDAAIYVFDNSSTDDSAALAEAAGAVVISVSQRGKGNVVRRMFRVVDADVYVMADSDDTYSADEADLLIRPILENEADMVTGDRLSTSYYTENKRPGHSFGNALVCRLIRFLWGCQVKDVMTGYRAFSRRFVKNCPILSSGFEIETEITLHAFDKSRDTEMIARAAAGDDDGFNGVVGVEDDVDGGGADASGLIMDLFHGGVSVKG